jgi:Zn finger protein HypA/HybF involved in hydrogenase expression
MTRASNSTGQEPRRNQRLLAAAAVVALVVAAALMWRAYRKEYTVEKAVTRATSDFVVEWRCLACGHTISANAGPGPKTCPKCNKSEMYVSLHWTCPAHGAQAVAFQYGKDGNPTQVKVGQGEWQPAVDADGAWNIRCPTCGGSMMPGG